MMPGMSSNNSRAFGQAGRVQGLNERKGYTLEAVSIRELAKRQATLARQLRPVRMAEIDLSFPYRAQLEEFQNKLHLPSVQDVLAEHTKDDKGKDQPAFRFLGLKVQRRVLDSTGAPVTEYQDIDLAAAYRPWLVLTGKRFEPEDPRYLAVSFPGLVMKRFLQFHHTPGGTPGRPGEPAKDDQDNHYKAVADKLTHLTEALAELAGREPTEIAAPPEQFNPEGFDPFNSASEQETNNRGPGMMGMGPRGPGSPQMGSGAFTGPRGPGAGGTGTGLEDVMSPGGRTGRGGNPAQAGLAVPKYCLVRLIDLTIEPGTTYQYRVQVRMANPNYHRRDVADPSWAEKPELTSDKWYEVPQKVAVPDEIHYYAVDQKELEGRSYKGPNPEEIDRGRQTVIQIQKWLGATIISSMGTKDPLMIGEWAVADRIPVYRGEYVDRNVKIELPVWSAPHNDWVIPTDSTGRRQKVPGIPISFSHDRPDGLETVLVDFEGGKQVYEHVASRTEDEVKRVPIEDACETEVLLLTPEGRLLGHETSRDAHDPEREKERQEVQKRVERIKKEQAATPAGQPGNPFGQQGGTGKGPGGSQ
jgi:hypothetical protein